MRPTTLAPSQIVAIRIASTISVEAQNLICRLIFLVLIPSEGTSGAASAPTAEDRYACRAMDCSKSSVRARRCSGRAGLRIAFDHANNRWSA